MFTVFHILKNAPTQPLTEGLKDLTVDGVAEGLGSMNGGWYLSSIMLFITIWAVRGRLNQQKTHSDAVDDLNAKHYEQAKEQTANLMAYMKERDAEVKELLQESTATTAEVANSIGIMANDLREVKSEVRHKLQAKNGDD